MMNSSHVALCTMIAMCMMLATQPAEAITVGSFSATTPEPDGFIPDGGDDQFDGGSLTVNGSSYDGGASGTLPNYTLEAQNVNGIEVTGRVDLFMSNGTTSANTRAPGLEDFVYARQFYTFTNPSMAVVNVPIELEYNLGSNGSTIVAATSSGDVSITAADLWSVTDDPFDGGPAEDSINLDPAVALLAADGLGLLPSDFSEPTTGAVQVDFSLALEPGESKSLMYFIASRNETDTFPETASRAQSQTDIELLLNNSTMQFNGLTNAEMASVVNFVVPEPASLLLLWLGWIGLLGLHPKMKRRRLTAS